MASLTQSALLPLPAMAATSRPTLKSSPAAPPAARAPPFHAAPLSAARLKTSSASRLRVQAAKEDFVEGEGPRQEASKQVQEALKEASEGLQEASEGVTSSVGEALHSLGDRVKGGLGADSGYTADVDAGSVTSAAKRAAQDVKGRVQGAGAEGGQSAGGVIESVRDSLQQAGEAVREKIEESVEGVRTGVSGTAESSTQNVSERVSGSAEGAKGRVEGSVDGLKKKVEEGVESVKDILSQEFRGAEIAESLLLSALKQTGALLAVGTLLLTPAFGSPATATANPLQATKEAAGSTVERFVGPRYENPNDAREAGTQHLFDAQEGLESVKGKGAQALGSVQEKGREVAGAVKGAVQSPVRGTQEIVDSAKGQGTRAVEGAARSGAEALGKVGETGRKAILEPLQRSADVPRSIADEMAEQAKFTGTTRKGGNEGAGSGDGSYVQGNAVKGAIDLLTGKGRETVEKVTPGGGAQAYPVDKDANAVLFSDPASSFVTVDASKALRVTVALDVGEVKDPVLMDVGNAIDATNRTVGEARGMFGGAQRKVEDAAGGVRGKAEEAKGAVEGGLEGAGESVKDTAGGINETVQEGINKAANILRGIPEDAVAGTKKKLEEVTKNLPDVELGKGADRKLSQEERDFQAKGSGAEKGAFKDGTELGKQMKGYMEK